MRRHLIEAAVPAHDATQFRRLDRKFTHLDGVSATKFLGKFAPENGDEIGLNQHGARRQIRRIQCGGRAVGELQGLGEKLQDEA